ncbi:MAG: malate synthase G [Pseudomonadales bacterium]
MSDRICTGGLRVDSDIYHLVNTEIIPGTGVDPDCYWRAFGDIVRDFAPLNQQLLRKRDDLQSQIDDWHRTRQDRPHDHASYKTFLKRIGYLLDSGDDFEITTAGVDSEISQQAGPQLVVPAINARFALNAANARWGSLYDALYGTDVIPDHRGASRMREFNPIRGRRVVDFGRKFLDQAVPLSKASHRQTAGYAIVEGALQAILLSGAHVPLSLPSQFVGYRGPTDSPSAILLKNNELNFELVIDREGQIGVSDPAGIQDILLEAALTTIVDCEDSVAAVDAEDKTLVYRNWLGLMRGDLKEKLEKNGNSIVRQLNSDIEYTAPDGTYASLPGRSLLFVRTVGLLMTTPAILDQSGDNIPEGIMDTMIVSLAALHDLKGNGKYSNSRKGSIYIVKPKMHGPEEVALTSELFARVEDALNLARNTIKMGIMDEERRTTVNLKACIRAASERVVFINTGFLDRTGDEIHTSMEAGAFAPREELKSFKWIRAYENQNVDVGLGCGFQHKAQIGKGMWAKPDNLASMLLEKGGHLEAGASTAWVPSPTAAILHTLHYHRINVIAKQDELSFRCQADLDDILDIPLLDRKLSALEIQAELDNNAQGILGYVVRWIDQGVGCSKVPDINNVGLMEDRATLRISSQHMANWVHHGLCTKTQVMATMKRMAKVVDEQNSHDPVYRNMAPDFDGSASFTAACDLVFMGRQQPSGYTEPLLHAHRTQVKQPKGSPKEDC